jgi:hypothetical protein
LATAIRRLASAKTKRDVTNSVAEAGSNNLFGGGESTDVVTSKVMEILGDEGYRKSYRRVQDFLENYAILADAASNSPDKKGRLSPLELIVMADSHARNPNDSSMTASAKADVQARLTSARKEWDQVTSDRLAAREAERKAKAGESQDTDVPQGRQQTPNEAPLPPETGTRSSEENGAIESPRDTSVKPRVNIESVKTLGEFDKFMKGNSYEMRESEIERVSSDRLQAIRDSLAEQRPQPDVDRLEDALQFLDMRIREKRGVEADVSRADNVKPSTGYERAQSELTENMTVPGDAPSEGVRDSMKAADEAISGKKTPEQILAELKKQREEAKFKMEQVRKGEC